MPGPDEITQLARDLASSVVEAEGEVPSPVRRAISEYAAGEAVGESPQTELDANIRTFARTVVHEPLQADIDGLLKQGKSEDEVLEIALSAAVGAGIARLERGLKVIGGSDEAADG